MPSREPAAILDCRTTQAPVQPMPAPEHGHVDGCRECADESQTSIPSEEEDQPDSWLAADRDSPVGYLSSALGLVQTRWRCYRSLNRSPVRRCAAAGATRKKGIGDSFRSGCVLPTGDERRVSCAHNRPGETASVLTRLPVVVTSSARHSTPEHRERTLPVSATAQVQEHCR